MFSLFADHGLMAALHEQIPAFFLSERYDPVFINQIGLMSPYKAIRFKNIFIFRNGFADGYIFIYG